MRPETVEALAKVLKRPEHAPMSTHDPRDGECRECPWPMHELPPHDLAYVLLAAIDAGQVPGLVMSEDAP